jgi:hypothetical protein
MSADKIVSALNHKRRDEALVRFHLGLDDGSPKTLRQTADRFGISAERVRQILLRTSRRARTKRMRPLIEDVLQQSVSNLERQVVERLLGMKTNNDSTLPPEKASRPSVLPNIAKLNPDVYMRNEFGLDVLRSVYSNAYKRWATAEDQQLKDEIAAGVKAEQIVLNHSRTPAAIVERINRLELSVLPTFVSELYKSQRAARKRLREESSDGIQRQSDR